MSCNVLCKAELPHLARYRFVECATGFMVSIAFEINLDIVTSIPTRRDATLMLRWGCLHDIRQGYQICWLFSYIRLHVYIKTNEDQASSINCFAIPNFTHGGREPIYQSKIYVPLVILEIIKSNIFQYHIKNKAFSINVFSFFFEDKDITLHHWVMDFHRWRNHYVWWKTEEKERIISNATRRQICHDSS